MRFNHVFLALTMTLSLGTTAVAQSYNSQGSTGDSLLDMAIQDRQREDERLEGNRQWRQMEFAAKRQAEQEALMRNLGIAVLVLGGIGGGVFFAVKNQSKSEDLSQQPNDETQ